MFTGLIEDIGTVTVVHESPDGVAMTIRCTMDLSDVQLGESIAVNGACFTVIRWDSTSFTFEASPESLARTTLAALNVGDRVHRQLEQ